jgi:general secretion pathway protein E
MKPTDSTMPAADGDAGELERLARLYGMERLGAVQDDMLDSSLLGAVPVEWARSNFLLPVRKDGQLCVLTCDPANVKGPEYLALILGEELRPILISRSEILSAIERCYFRKDDSPRDFLRDMEPGGPAVDPVSRTEDLLQVAENAPVTQLINLILLEAVKHRASDIHFEPFESRMKVRYRIDGVLFDQASPPKQMESALVSRLKVMARMDIAEKRLPQDGMARVRVGGREIDIRVSTVPVAEGERVVLRLLDRNSSLLPLEVLGMSGTCLDRFSHFLKEQNGMVVVSGPTGSGKTTTLYAALSRLDSSRRNIMTIEDPIEYQIPDLGQIQVKPKIGLTFAVGLRHILRQDPDVVLVGETRDLETAEIAIRASLTGHLVFTTLHTNDAPGAVTRLLDMGVEPFLIAECMKAVLAQRLARVLCADCRRKGTLRPEMVEALGGLANLARSGATWEPVGCPKCLDGYKGRIGLFELFVIEEAMREIIRRGKAEAVNLRAEAEKRGMTSLMADGVEKALRGVTSLSEVLSIVR